MAGFLPSLLLAAFSVSAATLDQIEAGESSVTFYFSQRIVESVLMAEDPPRLVVDMPETRFQAADRLLDGQGPVVSQIRAGQFADNPPISRAVLELRGPAKYQTRWDGATLTVTVALEGAAPAQAAALDDDDIMAIPRPASLARPSTAARPAAPAPKPVAAPAPIVAPAAARVEPAPARPPLPKPSLAPATVASAPAAKPAAASSAAPVKTAAAPAPAPAAPSAKPAPAPAAPSAKPAPAPVASKPVAAPAAPPVKPVTASPAKAPAAGAFLVQLGSFSSEARAKALQDGLKAAYPTSLSKRAVNGVEHVQVRVGPYPTRAEADAAVKKLAAAGHMGFVVKAQGEPNAK